MRLLFQLAVVLFISSCGGNKKDKYIIQKVSDVYAAKDIDIERGVSSEGYSYINVTIENSQYIDEDSAYEISNAASSVAIIVFETLSEEELNSDFRIEVDIKHRFKKREQNYSYSYSVQTLVLANHYFKMVDSIYDFLVAKQNDQVYVFFDESYHTKFERQTFVENIDLLTAQYGDITKYGVRGFDIVEMSDRKFLLLKTTAYRNVAQRLEFYVELNGSKNNKFAEWNMM